MCRRFFVMLLLSWFISPLHLQALPIQSAPPGVISGTVRDASKAPLPGATVIVTSSTGLSRKVGSTVSGEFRIEVPSGDYAIAVTAPGFQTVSEKLRVGAAATRDFILEVAGVQERVHVSAASPYQAAETSSATKTPVPLRDVPQSVTIVTKDLVQDQLMSGMADVVRYVPGMTAHQGENNRDDVVIRGNRSSADFFVNGVRDDVQYYRDLYNLERVEALKGPNAMIFGRGGGGGVVNRVLKEPQFQSFRSFSLQGGSFENRRVTADVDRPIGPSVALRVNGVFEDSGSFRRGVSLERSAINPTLSIRPRAGTVIVLGYERMRDRRVADRGITSFNGLPADVDRTTFYGDPAQSQVRSDVNFGTALVQHTTGRMTLRNRTVLASYDRFYQNFVPGAPTADATLVTLSAYNNATERRNLFNQTDVIVPMTLGRMKHTLLAGVEVGRQRTDNFRQTGFFGGTSTSIRVSYDQPLTTTPVSFRQNATDADNDVAANVAGAFVQDQVHVSHRVQFLAGIRADSFALRFHNRRNEDVLNRTDVLVSPRAGIVIKPYSGASLYGSYSVSYLPGSGDQFSSLTSITEQVKPEKFSNYELGAKWDMRSDLSFTLALYRLDRTNTRSTDPVDPARIVQTGSQRTEGIEAGVNGRLFSWWTIAGGLALQDALVTRATVSAREGAQVGQVPHRTASIWNNYALHRRFGAGVGIIYRSDMFAAIDNTVRLPSYTRIDSAAFVELTQSLRLQVNAENLFDADYYLNADSNTNISPGAPRSLRVALRARF